MIRKGFLDAESRQDFIDLARDGSVPHRLARRANALVLLDRGMKCKDVANILLLDDDTIRSWHKLYQDGGFDAVALFDFHGGIGRMSAEQEEILKKWISRTYPRSTHEVGAFIKEQFGLEYAARSSLINLMHRLGMTYRKPDEIPRKLDKEKQEAFVKEYENLLNSLEDDEEVLFSDAVHPTHAVHPAGCWAPKDTKIAVEQNSGRNRLNIQGAVNLASGDTFMSEVENVNAISTIALLSKIEAAYPEKRKIHVFLDNARYHHAVKVQEWLARKENRIRIHFIPPYCPHLNPIERLWGLMHKYVTHNRCYAKFYEFCSAILDFLRCEVPKNWNTYCDSVSDNFRIISPANFRVIG